jgi:DNA-binding NarL/FixJ family response regulator
MSPYHIVLAEDHLLFRQVVKEVLAENNDLEVVGEASDGLELLELLEDLSLHQIPDLVIVDISMPNLWGVEATRRIKQLYPGIKVLILSMHRDREYLLWAISAGAEGFLPKEGTDTELLAAIRMIQQGQRYISPLVDG